MPETPPPDSLVSGLKAAESNDERPSHSRAEILVTLARDYYRTQRNTPNQLNALRLLLRARLIGAYTQLTAEPPNYQRAIWLCDPLKVWDSYTPPVGAELLWHICGYDLVLCRFLAGVGESQQNFVKAARAAEYFATTGDLDAAARARLLSVTIGTRLALPNAGQTELAMVLDVLAASDARLSALAQQVLNHDTTPQSMPAGVIGPKEASPQFATMDFMHFHESTKRPE